LLNEPWRRLENALTGQDHLKADSIDAIQMCTNALYDLEERYPSVLIIEEANFHQDTITALIKTTDDDAVRHRLIFQAGMTAALTGWLFYDQGDYSRAANYYRVAERAASEVNDVPLVACVRTYRSYLASTQGSPGDAARFLRETISILPRQQPAMRSWLFARLAEECIMLGDRTDALRALDEAFLAQDVLNERGERPIWTRFFVPMRLDGMAVAAYARLNHPAMEAIADRLLRTVVSSETKVVGIVRADLSYAYLERGDIERGANLCQQALDTITKSGTRVGYERLAVISRTLSPYQSSSAAKGLWEQLGEALRVHQSM
jgi:tetratricopeptide (TPR) repeat protein